MEKNIIIKVNILKIKIYLLLYLNKLKICNMKLNTRGIPNLLKKSYLLLRNEIIVEGKKHTVCLFSVIL